jgi:Domain of unknown function (DUF3482)
VLVEVAALRRPVSAAELGQPQRRQAHVDALRQTVSLRAQRGIDELLMLYGFRESDTTEAPLPEVLGRHDLDLFNPDALLAAGTRLGKGVAIGAAVGVVADLAVAGLSLGAGIALGSTIGGVLSQGLNPLGRKVVNWFNGVEDLTVEDAVLVVLAQQQLQLLTALERRGHAATRRVDPAQVGVAAQSRSDDRLGDEAGAVQTSTQSSTQSSTQTFGQIVDALRPARGHPEWEQARHAGNARRQDVVRAVAARLMAYLAR